MSNSHYTVIASNVSQLADERDISKARAFVIWALHFFHEIDPDDAHDQSDTTANGDGGIDGWHRDDSARIFYLWQCKWTDNATKVFDHSPGSELLSAYDDLLNADVAATIGPKFAHLSADLLGAVAHGYEVRLVVAVPTEFTKRARKTLLARQKNYSKADGQPTPHIEILAAPQFEELALDREDITNDLTETTVSIRLRGTETMVLAPPTIPPNWKAAVVSLAGESLASLAAKYGRRLFHLNVRFALSHKQRRIQSIRDTLGAPETAQFFWFYNNGLTILCDQFKVKDQEIDIANPQVVNGCQTVNAFRAMYPRFGTTSSVLARVIQLPHDAGERRKQALAISQWTNSQMPVLGRDLHANDPIQKLIKHRFDNFSPPWFYEAKRGEWATLSKSARRKYGDRKVDMDRIGQCYRMISTPAEALTKKGDLFESPVYEDVFQDRDSEDYIVPLICRNYYWEFWHARQFDRIRHVCTEALDDARLRRLMRAKGQVVAHSVGLTCWLFQSGDTWVTKDAREAYGALATEPRQLDAWTKHVGIAFYNLLDILEKINLGRREGGLDELSLKKHLERKNQETFRDLQSSISNSASVLLGGNWKRQIIRKLRTQ